MATLVPIESWAKKSLQGITFWIGHRHCLYEHYPLGEAAFVAELCNLIFAHLDKSQFYLRCETLYREIAANIPEDIIGKQAPADIVIFKKPLKKGEHGDPVNVVEVKRGTASKKLIHADLKRLA